MYEYVCYRLYVKYGYLMPMQFNYHEKVVTKKNRVILNLK